MYARNTRYHVMRDTRLWDRAIFDGIPPVRGLTQAVTDDRLFLALVVLPRAPLEHPGALAGDAGCDDFSALEAAYTEWAASK